MLLTNTLFSCGGSWCSQEGVVVLLEGGLACWWCLWASTTLCSG